MKKCLFLVAALVSASTTFGSVLANEKYVTNTVNETVYNASTQIIQKVVTDSSVTNMAAVRVAKEYTDEKSAAVSSAAQAYADTQDEALKASLEGKIEIARTNAIDIAAKDATSKANSAKSDAKSYTDVSTNALNDKLTVQITKAKEKAIESAVGESKEYTDGEVERVLVKVDKAISKSVEIARTNAIDIASKDATTKANAAQLAAETTASADATTKANAAQAAAEATASADATTKANQAESNSKSYADGLKTTLEGTIAANKSDIEGKLANVNETLTNKIDTTKIELEGKIADAKQQVTDETDAKIAVVEGKIAGSFHFKGTCTYADLETKSSTAGEGDVWTVTDKDNECYAFVKEGETKKWVSLGKNFDLSSYKVWTDTKNYIDTADTTLDGKITTVDGKVTTLDTKVGTVKSDLESKITVVSNQVVLLDSKVDGNKTELEGKITAVETKADKGISDAASALARANAVNTDLTSKLSSTSNYLDTAVKAAKTQADKGVADAATAQSKADSVETALGTTKSELSGEIVATSNAFVQADAVVKSEAIAEAGSAADNKVLALKNELDPKIVATSNVAANAASAASTADSKAVEAMEFAVAASNNVMVAAKGFADAAETSAKTVALSTIQSVKTELQGNIDKKDDITSVNSKIASVSNNLETIAGQKASGAETAAKGYTDTEVAGLKTYVDTQDAGVSNNVLKLAKDYTDSKDPGSKSYVQEQIAAVSNNVIAIAATDAQSKADLAKSGAEATAKGYTDTEIGTLKEYVDTTSNNVLTAANTEAAKKVKALEEGAVATAAAAASTADSKAVAAKSAADTAQVAAEAAQSTADDAVTAAATADGKAVAAQGTADTAAAKLTDITGTVGNAISTAKSEAIASAATDASTKTNDLNKALIGLSGDPASAKTYYGLKKYTDSTFRKISDSYTKSQVYTKTEIDQQAAAAEITVSNMTENIVASKVNAQPKEPKATTEPEVYELKIKSNTVNTLLPKVNLAEGTEMYVDCEGERNFKLFLPAEPEVLIGLPITVETELPNGVQAAFATRKVIYKLPAKVVCEQPYSKLAVFTVTELETDTDWTPVITNMCIVCTNTATSGVSPKFVTVGDHALEGTSLHGGTEFKVVYPSNNSVVTNDLLTAGSDGKISGTFYYYTSKVDLVPASSMDFTTVGDKLTSWFKIIYKTVNGAAQVKQYNVSFDL